MNIFTFSNFKYFICCFSLLFSGTDGLLQGNFFDKLNAILLSLLVTQEMHLSNLTSTLQKSSNWINYAFNSNPTFNSSHLFCAVQQFVRGYF